MSSPIRSTRVSRDDSLIDQDGFRIPDLLPPIYGNGPDPIYVERLEDLKTYQVGKQTMDMVKTEVVGKEMARLQVAQLCLYTRKKLIPYIVHHFTVINKHSWSELFSPVCCVGNSPFYSACVDYFAKKKERFSNISVIFQDIGKLFPKKSYFGHNFLAANVKIDHQDGEIKKHSFIIDLTIRQFIKNARFCNDQANFFNEVLKNGFFELTKENFSIYQHFFKCHRANKWHLKSDSKTLSIEKLQIATSKNDYTDEELVSFLNPK